MSTTSAANKDKKKPGYAKKLSRRLRRSLRRPRPNRLREPFTYQVKDPDKENEDIVLSVHYALAPTGEFLGPNPSATRCPFCQEQVVTKTKRGLNDVGWVTAGLLCVLGLWPCAFLPWLFEGTKAVIHECPICGAFLGRHKCRFAE